MAVLRLVRQLITAAALVPAMAGAAAGDLRILAVEEPPTAFVGKGGQVEGLAVDVVRALQQQLGDTTPVEILPEVRAMQTAERQPNVVLLGFSRTAERENRFHWIAPLIRKPWVLYLRAGDHRPVDAAAMRRFSAIAVVSGDVRQRWLQAQGYRNLLEAGSPEQAMRMLQSGRVEALFHEPQGVAYFCRVHGCSGKVPVPAWVARHSEVWILMSGRTAPETARRWQVAARALQANGTIERLGRQWSEVSRQRFGIESFWHNGLLEFCGGEAVCRPLMPGAGPKGHSGPK